MVIAGLGAMVNQSATQALLSTMVAFINKRYSNPGFKNQCKTDKDQPANAILQFKCLNNKFPIWNLPKNYLVHSEKKVLISFWSYLSCHNVISENKKKRLRVVSLCPPS